MAVNEEWGRQLRAALRAYEEREDARLSWSEIGRRVGARLGRAPFASQTVGAWFKDGQEPEPFIAVAAAIAYVLKADPGALVFPPERGQVPNELVEEITAERAAKRADQKAPPAGRRRRGTQQGDR